MEVLALVSDLMMQSQVTGAAQRTGAQVTFALSPNSLAAKLAEASPELVIVDLTHPGLDVEQLMRDIGPALPESTTTLAFGPHVHKQKLEAAAAAGFKLVLTRGQFHGGLVQLLASGA